MKLILSIVSNDDASKVTKALIKENFMVTKLSTTGGFFMSGNTTLLVGAEDDDVNTVIEVIGNNSKKRSKIVPNNITSQYGVFQEKPLEVKVGGATIFVLNVERHLKV